MTELEGKIAFITGAASGIGLELARACDAAGTKVMLADIDDPGLSNAEESLLGAGMDVAAVHCDISDPESIQVQRPQRLNTSTRFTCWSTPRACSSKAEPARLRWRNGAGS